MRKRIIGGAAALVLTAGLGLGGLSAPGENAGLNSLKARTVQTDDLNSLKQTDDLNSLSTPSGLNSLKTKAGLNSL